MIPGLETIGFARAWILPLLVLVPFLAVLYLGWYLQRRRAVSRFAGLGAYLTTRSAGRWALKAVLSLGAITLVILAAAGPQIGTVERQVTRTGLDIAVALDTSQSMAVQDVQGASRLAVAEQIIEGLTEQLGGSRMGLAFFGADAIVRYPTTFDLPVIRETLDYSGRGFRPRAGSSTGAGIAGALQTFPQDVLDSQRPKAIIVISDGEDPNPTLPPFEALAARNLRIYTIGIGTPQGGPIPTYDLQGQFTGNLRDGNQVVTSRLDPAVLEQLASASGGRYWGTTTSGIVPEMVDELRRFAVDEGQPETVLAPDDRYQWFLGLAAILLVLEWLLSDRRPMPAPRPARGTA